MFASTQPVPFVLGLVALGAIGCGLPFPLPGGPGSDPTFTDGSRSLGQDCEEQADCATGLTCDADYVCAGSPAGVDAGVDPQDAGTSAGTPVTVSPTTSTTGIPTVQKCSGSTYGSKGDLPAVNTPVFVASTNVTALTLRYDMNIYFGEPTRAAVVSWEGTGSMSSVQWLAEVQDEQGRQYVTGSGKRIFASYQVGSIKGPGQGFGSDTTGSPSWSQTFVTYDASQGVVNGVTDVEAKNIYKACFKLAQVRLLKLNGATAMKR